MRHFPALAKYLSKPKNINANTFMKTIYTFSLLTFFIYANRFSRCDRLAVRKRYTSICKYDHGILVLKGTFFSWRILEKVLAEEYRIQYILDIVFFSLGFGFPAIFLIGHIVLQTQLLCQSLGIMIILDGSISVKDCEEFGKPNPYGWLLILVHKSTSVGSPLPRVILCTCFAERKRK